jgi:M6 family metalloprotease-like protein
MEDRLTRAQGALEVFVFPLRLFAAIFVYGLVLSGTFAQGNFALHESSRAAQVRALNNSVLQLHAQVQENATITGVVHGQAAAVLAQRATTLQQLVQENPRVALSFAFSPELLADLKQKFPDAASLLESHVSLSGSVEHWIADSADMKSSKESWFLNVGGSRLGLYFATPQRPDANSGPVVTIEGVQLGAQVAVSKFTSNPLSASFLIPGGAFGAKNLSSLVALLLVGLLVAVAGKLVVSASRAAIPAFLRQIAVCAMALPVAVCNPLTASAQSVCSTTGVQNVAVLLINFQDAAISTTSQQAYDAFFDTAGRSLNGYWQEASYGRASASGSVFGPFTIGPSTSYTCAVFQQLTNDVLSAATAGGVNLQSYQRIFVIFPGLSSCAWIGATSMGSFGGGCGTWTTSTGTLTASLSYLVDSYMSTTYYPWTNARDGAVELLAHEGGHQLGLPHSGTIDNRPTAVLEPAGAAGHITDQGDEFAVMGAHNLGHYHSQQKATLLGWMNSGTNYQTVTSSGTYTLQPIEASPSGVQALKIQRGSTPGYYLWLEYKQPVGQYDNTLNNGPLYNSAYTGAMITYEDPYYEGVGQIPGHTYLVDFNLGDVYWETPDLNPGQTWTDTYSNLSIFVQSASSSGLTVNVNYSGTPSCISSAPAVTASPLNPSIYPAQTASYSVNITNNDSSACAPSTFNLTSTQPSGWTTSFSSLAVTLNPGQSASVTMGKGAPTGTPAGTYAVNMDATNSTFSTTDTANATVFTPPSLAVSVSISGASFVPPGLVPITAAVTNGGSPASGASVTFSLTLPNATTITQSATTGSNGVATWNYKLGPRSSAGTYSVVAQASTTGSSGGAGGKKTVNAATVAVASNTATFIVQ